MAAVDRTTTAPDTTQYRAIDRTRTVPNASLLRLLRIVIGVDARLDSHDRLQDIKK
ncbi:hypothetical protein Vau01_117280 [Virgisporangium aurantiacum]|uniref:Uncharacterized protein n=1 Tax=Virgisporangium aurantiacum TaxID=175570 RepID=A0A8J4E9Y4_9ACTN|nr:hypothetical protein Vau01_117280 [Virgisporangium aurantiacum]